MSSSNSAEQYMSRDSFTGFQILAVSLCALISIFDGFDVMAIAYTAPAIANEWGLSAGKLGVVFSAGYLGMALGAMSLGTLSDHIGRRNMILICLVGITVAMGLTSTAGSVNTLMVYRFGTGLAIGAMLASITAVTAEYSPDAKRNFMICLVQGTYAIGATLGGMLSAFLIEDFGWRMVFSVGAVMNAAIFVLVFLLLPESLAFLLHKRPQNGLPKANRIIAKLGGEQIQDWPAQAVQEQQQGGISSLLQGETRRWSLLLWVSTFSAMFGLYFLMSWIPKIVVDSGMPLDKAIWIGMSINAGGFLGILWLGYRSAVSGLRFMVAAFMCGAGVLMIVFGQLQSGVWVLMAIAVVMGFFAQGGFIGLYSVAARLYPTSVRATGIGWAIGIGRLGAIVGPSMAGLLIGMGWEQGLYFTVLSIPFFIGAITIWLLRAKQLEVGS